MSAVDVDVAKFTNQPVAQNQSEPRSGSIGRSPLSHCAARRGAARRGTARHTCHFAPTAFRVQLLHPQSSSGLTGKLHRDYSFPTLLLSATNRPHTITMTAGGGGLPGESAAGRRRSPPRSGPRHRTRVRCDRDRSIEPGSAAIGTEASNPGSAAIGTEASNPGPL